MSRTMSLKIFLVFSDSSIVISQYIFVEQDHPDKLMEKKRCYQDSPVMNLWIEFSGVQFFASDMAVDDIFSKNKRVTLYYAKIDLVLMDKHKWAAMQIATSFQSRT